MKEVAYTVARTAAYTALVLAGLLGLHFNVEYSGWVVAVGLLGFIVD